MGGVGIGHFEDDGLVHTFVRAFSVTHPACGDGDGDCDGDGDGDGDGDDDGDDDEVRGGGGGGEEKQG